MKTLRQQLTTKLILGFTVPLVLGGLGVFLLTRAALQEQFDAALHAKAMAITTVTRQSAEGVDVDTADPLMHDFEAPHHGRSEEHAHTDYPSNRAHDLHHRFAPGFFQLWRADGTVLRRSESLTGADLPFLFGTLTKPRFWDLTLPSDLTGRAVGFSFEPPPLDGMPQSSVGKATAKSKGLVIVMAVVRHDLDDTLATLALVLSGCGLLLLGVIALMVPRVLGSGFVPLISLADQAAHIDADSLNMRFPTGALPAELVPISHRMNDLLARLEQSFERERRFSADLAHELRTPIAELRSLAELSLKWPDARPAGTDHEMFDIAIQMEGIVARLLELLRSERSQLPVTRDRLALASLLKAVWRPFASRAESKQLRVSLTLMEGVEIETDSVLLRSILVNLLDNAVEYSPSGAAIWMETEIKANDITVSVVNEVEQLVAADVSNLFERFWRKDAARSSAYHSGLGLSLARAFARALGGDLTATLDTDSRLRLNLSLPQNAPAKTSNPGSVVIIR